MTGKANDSQQFMRLRTRVVAVNCWHLLRKILPLDRNLKIFM